MTSWIQNLCCYHRPGFITCEIKVCCVGLIHTLHVSFKTINQEIFLVNANHKNRRIWYLINYSIPLLLFLFIFRFLTFTQDLLENPLMEVRIIMHYINISQSFLFRLNPIYRIQRENLFIFCSLYVVFSWKNWGVEISEILKKKRGKIYI
jgi:hypothetical protein